MHERSFLAERETGRDGERETKRLDKECGGGEEVDDDVASEDGLDLGYAGVEGVRSVDLDKDGRDDGEQDL